MVMTPPTPTTSHAADNNVKDADDTVQDGLEDGGDAVDDAHQAGADGLEDGFDLAKRRKEA